MEALAFLLIGSYIFCFAGVIGLLARTGRQARRIEELTREFERLKNELTGREFERDETPASESAQTADVEEAAEAAYPFETARTAAVIPEVTPVFAAPFESATAPAPAPVEPHQAPETPSPALESLRRFVRGGNLWAAGGVLLLVTAFALLITYLARRGFFTVEMGIAAAALSGLAMLFAGWRFRKRRPLYFLLLQGGGIGILYLSVFAAHKLTPYFPQIPSLVLLSLLVLPAVILALLQNSQALAVLGTAGGFAAPVLLSAGGGNHVFLFAYYLVLDAGVLIIGFRRFWKWLDMLSLAATFGVSLVWLFAEYQQDFFWTTEPFMLGFIAVFTALGLRALRKNAPDFFDDALFLAAPVAGALTQWRVFSFIPHGYAVICVVFAAAYLALTAWVWRMRTKFGEQRARPFAAGYLAFSALLANLAIPLELQAEVTSAVWAAEGALVFVFGLWRKDTKPVVAGVILHTAAAAAFFIGNAGGIAYNAGVFRSRQFLGAVIVSLSAFVMLAGLNYSAQKESAGPDKNKPAWALAAWAFCWWFGAWIFECFRVTGVTDGLFKEPWALIHALCAVTAALSFALSRVFRCQYLNLGIAPSLLAAAGLVFSALGSRTIGYFFRSPTSIWTHNFFAGEFLFPWLIFFAVHATLIFATMKSPVYEAYKHAKPHAAWMFAALLITAAVLSASGRALTAHLKLAESWTALAGILPSLALVTAITFKTAVFAETGAAHKKLMLTVLPAILRAVLALWFVVTLFMTGNPAPLPVYVPFINPLDLEQGFCVAAVLLHLAQERARRGAVSGDSKKLFFALGDIMVFLWLTAIIARSVRFYAKEPVSFMFESPVFHLTAFIVWAFYGIAHIIAGHKRARRAVWIAGAALIVCDIAKLLIFDLAGTGAVMRIVSFFIAGAVMLFIGWAAPLPPARSGKNGDA